MFKMLAYELSTRAVGISCRQMFVTQSPALADRVKAYYERLKSLDLKSDEQDVDDSNLPTFTLEDVDPHTRQDAAACLPVCWKDLGEQHFPLFLSFDEVWELG